VFVYISNPEESPCASGFVRERPRRTGGCASFSLEALVEKAKVRGKIELTSLESIIEDGIPEDVTYAFAAPKNDEVAVADEERLISSCRFGHAIEP
jgi:hypothetical protein